MKNKIYKTFSITLSLCLSGCMGIYEGGFECPAGTGVGCKSISDVNEMVNLGELPQSLNNSRDMASDSTDKTYKCDTCGRSFSSSQTKPEIWINPLYLKNRQEELQEDAGKEILEEWQEVNVSQEREEKPEKIQLREIKPKIKKQQVIDETISL